MGRVSTVGEGRSAAHFNTRIRSLRSSSAETNSDLGASREATQAAPKEAVTGRLLGGGVQTSRDGTTGRGAGIKTLRVGRLNVHAGAATTGEAVTGETTLGAAD